MDIVFFTKYSRSGASSRYRSFQYLPSVDAAGVGVRVCPLFDDAYLAYKFANGRTRLNDVFRAFARRLWAVLTLPQNAVVVIEYELLPYMPALLERWLARRGCRMVVDYDDALFHQYDNHRSLWVRWLLSQKIATVMRLAHTVVAGNAYLASYAQSAGARRVTVVPTVVDLVRYSALIPVRADEDICTIGWIGSPTTARYLLEIAPALADVCRSGRARVRLIGCGPIELRGVPVDILPWCEDTEIAEIARFSVGIMPLPSEPWARGKCGFKLVQYMACGLPVVASPVGVNQEMVESGHNGFLAETGAQWVAALELLRDSTALRARLGRAGRARVEARYCLAVTAPKWTALLQTVGTHDR